ncbi:hypothetical protein ANCCEY_00802 [Ancylostoma ceylanicum]|uniref:Fatty acid desaturase domain-containing protein n=1 Tax=Ancylostoma ceylanicum TaxID=53326 RepID=A0A0D6M7H2_9BILA|nr:hypothetical protein ANCCEY_00802 [Ancylostoma ceylanicum]
MEFACLLRPPPKLPTVDDVRKAIPPHCFEKNLLKSVRYLVQVLRVRNLCLFPVCSRPRLWTWLLFELRVGERSLWTHRSCANPRTLLAVAEEPSPAPSVGHDCGHGSFSNYEWVNDLCGHIAHAPILAPYWPWQKSHRQHHQYTSHLDKDKGHPWVTEQDFEQRTTLEKYFASFPLSGWIRWVLAFWLDSVARMDIP